jgi:integrase
MHKARHTAGQHVLDTNGTLKAVRQLLGHASIRITGDIYRTGAWINQPPLWPKSLTTTVRLTMSRILNRSR